jgi:hypothetical protein
LFANVFVAAGECNRCDASAGRFDLAVLDANRIRDLTNPGSHELGLRPSRMFLAHTPPTTASCRKCRLRFEVFPLSK